MNTKPAIQSEVSQKEKNKYRVLMHIFEIQKNDTDEPICRAGIEMQKQRTDFGHSRGRSRWDELRELHWQIYITMCKIDSPWEAAVWAPGTQPGAL